MAQALQFLIIDGYAKASRDDFDVAGMRQAWKLYEDLLSQHLPNAESKVWFPSDHAEPPAGPADFHAVLWTGCNLTIYADEARVLRACKWPPWPPGVWWKPTQKAGKWAWRAKSI